MSQLRIKPGLFSAKEEVISKASRSVVNNFTLSQATGSVYTGSFKLDAPGMGIRSTQELNTDFSQFKNHTFFGSAKSKVDIAFYKIFNQFPFDESYADIDEFLDQLTGFEKYIYDSIDKNIGYLFFSGTTTSENPSGGFSAGLGTFIEVNDIKGFNFQDDVENYGEQGLNLSSSPFSFEMQLFIPSKVNDNQIILQRLSNSGSITLALSQSSNTTDCKILYLVSSASNSYLVASGSIEKGIFNHIFAKTDDDVGGKRLSIYRNLDLIATSSDIQNFGVFDLNDANLFIGSGSNISILDYQFNPKHTLSGAIDDLRHFIGSRLIDEVESDNNREIYASDNLALYFKFDEPGGIFDYNNVVLDSSGNSLHSYITNFTSSLRTTASIDVPVINQRRRLSPVLFSNYANNTALMSMLEVSASTHDKDNPNYIINLFPQVFFQESANLAGFSNIEANAGSELETNTIPGTEEFNAKSNFFSILSVFANELDELKIVVDSFSNINNVEPGSDNQVIDKFLPFTANYFGFTLPPVLAKSTFNQFISGDDLTDSEANSSLTIQNIRNTIWRRLLSNATSINRSKGTHAAIRSAFLSMGIVPENFFRIREYGMAGESRLLNMRDAVDEVSTILALTASVAAGSSVDYYGFNTNSPRIVGQYLSASRIEVGFPEISGTFVNKSIYSPHGISNVPSDGLLTSGSFSFEASYIFDENTTTPAQASLVRLHSTGSSAATGAGFIVANLIYDYTASDLAGSLVLGVRPSSDSASKILSLRIDDVNLYDGNRWHISFSRQRNDVQNAISSSYTLLCSRQVGEDYTFFSASNNFFETTSSLAEGTNIFQNIKSDFNASGTFIIIGSQSIPSSDRFLNNNTLFSNTNFIGTISQIRFWSKDLDKTSYVEHVKNFKSTGINDPILNYGFDTITSGSFEKLRIDASVDQGTITSDTVGNIRIFDFSQNNLHFSGSGFGSNTTVIKPQTYRINRISPVFDLQQTNQKVRIRGLLSPNDADPSYIMRGEAYKIFDNDTIQDDVRLAIEHSIVKALNEDIIGLIGDAQFLENSMGAPELMFSDVYPDIDQLRKVYFNRLTGKLDLNKTYDIFRWVDTSITTIIESLLPKKTQFLGINYVIEPHILERGKHRYGFEKMFTLAQDNNVSSELLLTILEGVIKRT